MIVAEDGTPATPDQDRLFDVPDIPTPGLAGTFGVPPFSILDTRQGYWQARKRQWLDMGLRSELGRGEALLGGWSTIPPDLYKNGRAANAIPGGSRWPTGTGGGPLERKDLRAGVDADPDNNGAGTSIFDPVLCELTYHWYSPDNGLIHDPFAGGSVRGIVAAYCGRWYDGIDLRPEQVAANQAQWADIAARRKPPSDAAPAWHTADSRNIAGLGLERADLIFTCPPYYNLEVYSDNPDDLSRAGTYNDFLEAYRAILKASAALLRPDRYAVLVVSEIRDKKGLYRGFVHDTITAMRDAGLGYYGDAALLNASGSLPLRAARQFQASRKLGRSHQHVLTFVKGDGKAAAQACGPCEMPDFGRDE